MKITKKYRLLMSLFSFMLFFVFAAENGLHGQEIVITPASQLSEVDEDNEIVMEYGYKINRNGKKIAQKNDPVAVHFVNRNSGDTCNIFNIKENSPYHFSDLKRSGGSNNTDNGSGPYDLTTLSKQEIIQRYKLQNTPAPIPDNFHFRNVNWWCSVDIKPNHILLHYVTIFGGGRKESTHSMGHLLLADKNTYLVLNHKGEILWQKKEDYVGGAADLSNNGLYLGIVHCGEQPDYWGDYKQPCSTYILDIHTNKSIFEAHFTDGLAEKDNVFTLRTDATHIDSAMLYRLDTNDKIAYSFTFNKNEYVCKNSNGSEYEIIEQGFIWNGVTYLIWIKNGFIV